MVRTFAQKRIQLESTSDSTVNPASEESLLLLSKNYTLRLVTVGNYMYLGQANIGSAEGSAVWQIKRIDSTTGIVILFADGNDNYDNVWTNYATLTYI